MKAKNFFLGSDYLSFLCEEESDMAKNEKKTTTTNSKQYTCPAMTQRHLYDFFVIMNKSGAYIAILP